MKWLFLALGCAAFGLAFMVVFDWPPILVAIGLMKWVLIALFILAALVVVFIGLVAYHDPR